MAFKGITAFVLGNNGEGGGGGGTTNYNDLTNHPQINGNELTGNKTADQLGLLPSDTDIPTKLSDLDEDVTHRTVTDLEKQSWNNKVDSVAGKGLSTNDYTDEDKTALANKVDKVTGKGLSTNDYTDGEKEDVAQVDGLVSSVGGLTSRVGIAEGKVRTLEGEMLSVQDALDTKVDKETGKGLSTNDYSNADKAIVDGVTTALAGKVDTSSVGTANGVAGLDNTGRVPSSQLPSYVDDVLEYASLSAFPATGEGGKIYIALDTNKTYRWSGSAYVEISESLALGETQGTAYEGNKGKANADAIDALETTVEAIPEQIETVVKDTVGFVGKNKLPYFTETKTASGTLTVIPSNGRYSFTGTPVSATAIMYPVSIPINSGIYRFIADGYVPISMANITLYYNDNGTIKALAPNETIDLSIYTITDIAFFAGAGITANYQNIGLMLVEESISDKSFEPYHESVQEMFDSLGTASTKNSTSVVTDSSDLVESGAVKDIVGWGNKNLLPNDMTTQTVNGITFAVQEDKSVIANGTASADWARVYFALDTHLPVGDYLLSGVTGGASNTYRIVIELSDNTSIGVYDGDASFSIAQGVYITQAYVAIRMAGYVANNVVFKPMIRKADIVDPTYEPYHASVKDTLRDAEVIEGKNLFPRLEKITSLNGIVYTPQEDGSIIVNGTATNWATLTVKAGILLKAGTYAISGSPSANGTYVTIYTESETYNSVAGVDRVFTLNADTIVEARISVKNGMTITNAVYKPQLELGDTVTPFEPYYTPLKDVVTTKADNSVIGTVEDGATASKDYAVGDYFIKDTILGKTKAAIASGGTFTKDTNYEETNVAKELTELYKYIGILTTPVEAFTANSLPILKRNITNAFYNGSLRGEIAAGNFKNVRPGDYIIGQATGSTYYVAECDYWLGNGDSTNGTTYPAYNTHHLGLMLFKPVGITALWRGYGYSDKSWRVSAADLGRCPWNAETTVDPTDTEAIGSNSTNITRSYNGTNMSAYMGSFIRERIDAILLPQCFQADFGSENVLKRRNWLSNAINASAASGARSDWQGIASGSVWVDRFIDLASEVELYGSRINSSSRDDIGVQNKQLPIYRNGRIHDFYPRMDLWTKGCASAADAARRDFYGVAYADGASAAGWACPLGCVK